MNIRKTLIEAKSQGLSYVKVANFVGCHPSTINRLATGNASPDNCRMTTINGIIKFCKKHKIDIIKD